MKKVFKSRIFLVILTVVICVSVTTYAVVKLQANEIGYKDGTVEDALDNLYSNPATKKFCELKSGTALTVGAKYECDPGDSVMRNFFVLAVDSNKVKLIMERNITEGTSSTTMTWMNAMKYIDNNNLKASWSNVLDVDLPMAQDIANAVGNTGWKMADKNYNDWFCFGLKDQSGCIAGNWTYSTDAEKEAVAPYKYLFNYTRDCSAYGCDSKTSLGEGEAMGYWTRDIIPQLSDYTARAWPVNFRGALYFDPISNYEYIGVRLVITVLKSNLDG